MADDRSFLMRLLMFGGTGMLGHVLWEACRERLDAHFTVRSNGLKGAAAAVLDPERAVRGVRAEDPLSIERALDETGAEVAVNCIGVVKQASAADNPIEAIQTNALFPHQLAAACREGGVRLIHISTDCVFSGRRGEYTEDDEPDPPDLYGRSKLLGEVSDHGTITLRTSMIGRELETTNGLLEWFLSQADGTVRGFTRAVFTGPTTPVLARLIADIVEDHQDLEGTWHVGAEPIAKYDLLRLVRDAVGLEIEIQPDDTVAIDRSLDSTRLRSATGWNPPSWPEMIAELGQSAGRYAHVRKQLAHR
jgi:dTDP-4-dehydrorhamnose reductase